jgi:hypothetical protein
MNEDEILTKLLEAKTTSEVDFLVRKIISEFGNRIELVPIGKRENNRGIIEINRDPGRGIVERITNGIDAILEYEHFRHNGIPGCRNPREAAGAWLNIPSHGLYELSAAQRRELANFVVVTIEEGDDKFYRTVQILDKGIGISVDQMPLSILSLGETNKLQKLYLSGAFGQGGSSTFASCTYSLIASRLNSDSPQTQKVGFTIVFYQDLPPELYKHGRYVYLTLDGSLFKADLPLEKFPKGTIVRHFGYDLSSYVGALGPGSVYGLLQHALFDPIIPLFLEDKVHSYRRVIKGSRNALNGAVDESDERGPNLSHNITIYYVKIGDFGYIGIEYWVLEQSEKERYPSRAYVDNKRPIILTINGQSHAELPASLIRNQLDLPYLVNRLIVHLDCNNLTPQAKRNLFVSSREDVRKSEAYKLIEEELIKALRSDDKLKILNEEAKNLTLKEKDEEAEKIMRSEVAKILRFYGFPTTEAVGGVLGETKRTESPTQPVGRAPIHKLTKIINLHDPPTYVKILADPPIKFYPEQRRYVRIETDAPSTYHNAEDIKKSRVNIILTGNALHLSGTTPLKEGRMRVILDCSKNAIPDMKGEVIIEISRPGLPTIFAKVPYLIIEKPEAPQDEKQISVPPIDWIAVEGPDDPNWSILNWSDDIKQVASCSILSYDKLAVYYSKVFPDFSNAYKKFERMNTTLAQSFETRYRIWLAVHSLLLEQDKKQTENIEKFEEMEFEERRRLAAIASMFASHEVRSGQSASQLEIE